MRDFTLRLPAAEAAPLADVIRDARAALDQIESLVGYALVSDLTPGGHDEHTILGWDGKSVGAYWGVGCGAVVLLAGGDGT